MTSSTTALPARPRRTPRRAATAAAAALAGLVGSLALAAPASAVTQASAETQFRAAGITWTSSGGCTDRTVPTCTSFDGLRQTSVDGAITLKRASGCALTITGGTETGHAGGTYSHSAGYKLDFSRTSCLTSWVQRTYTYVGQRSDGAALYRAASGNEYADEGNHWDVTYYTCGC
ncbi:hypothetical protein [Nocardioides sp. Leaf374]|uniref:hypothetical protein n=1 Tax=Nocardioides sp. Leaf374 TaxID=2876560 RepID=UPI001E3779A3|nr:hypothetical protein [Nocardioides sp. Leaf374]